MAAQTAEAARAEQVAIAALAARAAMQTLDVLDGNELAAALEVLLEQVEATVDLYGDAAAGAAAEWFRELRAEHISGRFPVRPVSPPPPGFIDSAVVDGVAARLAGTPDVLDSRVEQLVLDQGRKQLIDAVARDSQARGWARVTKPGACSFCMMLALRAGSGLLYTSKRAASFRAHSKQPNGSGGDCRCGVEPVWGQYEPTAAVRDAQRVWAEATKGRKGEDARAAFRQALEGREVTGAKDKRPSNKRGERFATPSGVTPENQRAQLRILEALPPAKTPEAAQWRVRRVAEIRKFLGD